MSYQGIDTCARIKDPRLCYDKGIRFIGRYLVPEEVYGAKAINAAEASAILSAGVGLLLCWETNAQRASEGAKAGTKDGTTAQILAQKLGVPENVTLYFAVDYVPPLHDYDAIEAYFRTAAANCAPYGCGIYGPFAIVEEIVRRIPTLYVWQCVGGSGGKVSELADVYQYQWQGGGEAQALAAELGYAVDLDTCEDMSKAGLWLPDAPKPWYTDTVNWALKEGIVTEARPTDFATRAEVMQMIRNYSRRFEEEDNKTYSGLLEG